MRVANYASEVKGIIFDIVLLMDRLLMNISSRATFRITNLNRLLWHSLLYLCLLYNSHRYLFKYSHGAYGKPGYQQTPLIWQAGKFFLVSLLLLIIYSKSSFNKKIPVNLLIIYVFLLIFLLINLFSIAIYEEVATDEIEYLLFAFSLLPLGFMNSNGIMQVAEEIKPILNVSQYIIIISNWIVIFNYFVFRIVPFHAYEGILLRFGGLWDDPNTLAIISVLLLGYAIFNKQYVMAALHVINILFTISFNGYILLIVTTCYFFLNTDRDRITRILILGLVLVSIVILTFLSYDFLAPIYEAKRGSVEEHAAVNIIFNWAPLLHSIQFHETWWLSLVVNYFPFSIPVLLSCSWVFIQVFFIKPKSIQRLFFILFFVTSFFLPFLYMFPVNFVALLFLVLYVKGVRF